MSETSSLTSDSKEESASSSYLPLYTYMTVFLLAQHRRRSVSPEGGFSMGSLMCRSPCVRCLCLCLCNIPWGVETGCHGSSLNVAWISSICMRVRRERVLVQRPDKDNVDSSFHGLSWKTRAVLDVTFHIVNMAAGKNNPTFELHVWTTVIHTGVRVLLQAAWQRIKAKWQCLTAMTSLPIYIPSSCSVHVRCCSAY